MEKSEIRIFIVDDDPTMAKALQEMVRKLGFRPVVAATPTEAQNQFRVQGANLFFIDCLLPRMSGVELAVSLRADGAEAIPMILSSGVYRDKSFIKDALHKTGAIAFLTKPFNIADLQKIIQDALQDLVEEDVSPLETLMVTSPSPGEKIKIVNQLEQVEAFDIPWLCTLMMNTSVSGVLELQNEKDKSSISFGQGKIIQVDMQNPESFFGSLLIENGYLSPEQLEQALAVKSSKKLGERLVDLNLLSPHVIDLINAEQTAIRLSRLITDSTYNVKFIERTLQSNASSIDSEKLAPYLVDWINSKIQPTFIKQRYLKWLDSSTVKLPTAFLSRRLWNMAPLRNVPALVTDFEKGFSLAQVLSKNQFPEDLVYQVFHLLVINDYLKLKRELKVTDESAQSARLQRIWGDMQTQDLFSVLGVNRNAKQTDIKKRYHELAKIFHPDKLPSNASSVLKNLGQQVFGQMTKAYETLSNDQKKTTYLKELEMGKAEKILEAEALFEDGKTLLKSGQTSKAREKFEAAALLRPPTSEILIHLAWTRLQTMEAQGVSEEALFQVETTLNKIPPEDRHNYTYYFVKGLFQNMLGEEAAAKKNLQHALSLNPKFIEAERALRVLDLKKVKPKDLFHGDLKEVVTGLFRRPK